MEIEEQVRVLRELIAKSGLTQDEVATKLGITTRALKNYIGLTRPRKAPNMVILALRWISKGKKNESTTA